MKLITGIIRFNVFFAIVALLSACGGGGDGGSDPTIDVAPPGVIPPPPPPVVLPSASLDREPTSGVPGIMVQFRDTSEAGSEPITAWLWDFGDGQSSTDQNPSHIYTTVGSFDVSLRVTTSVGSDIKNTTPGVVVLQAPPGRITQSVGSSAQTPAIPKPALFGDVLPFRSAERLVSEVFLREFNPVVNQALITTWAGRLDVNDCRVGAGIAQIPEPASASTAMRTSIPKRNTTFLYTTLYFNFYHDFLWGGEPFPRNLLLIGQYDNPADPTFNGRSFDLGGSARWESCEENTPVFDFHTNYVISYNARLSSWPILRHYKVWRLADTILEPGDGVSPSLTKTWRSGLTETRAQEVTATITATAGASGGPFTSELSASLSATLSTAITVSSDFEESLTFFADSSIKPGYMLQRSAWYLTDIYRIEGITRGSQWSDPNYVLAPNQLEFEVNTKNTRAFQSAWFLPTIKHPTHISTTEACSVCHAYN